MPKGKPNPQTIATEKYQKKAGYMTKGFKIKRDIAEQFEEACEKTGVSQAGQITKMMQAFSKNAVEAEYIEKKNELFERISNIDIGISELKKIQKEMKDEKACDLMGRAIKELYMTKENIVDLIYNVYEFYNKLYMQTDK